MANSASFADLENFDFNQHSDSDCGYDVILVCICLCSSALWGHRSRTIFWQN